MAVTSMPVSRSTMTGLSFADMPGTQRAAALLLLLGEEDGAPIWRMLEEDEIKKVSHAMVQLGSLEAEAVEQLIIDFVSRLSASGGITSSFERTEALLLKIFPPEQVSVIMAEVKGASTRRVWASLTQIDPEILASFLRNEYPQTVAVILSRVRSDYAAKVLTILPEDFAIDVLNRMLRMETVQKEALRHIEEILRVEFVSTIAQTTRRDAHELLADVFNAFDRQTEIRFLTALDQSNRGSAKKIRQLMFTFDDLMKLDAGSVQTLMRSVDRDVLARALKGASDPVRAFFFANMSSRSVKNMQNDMESLGPIRLKEVDEAQSKMTDLAKELAEKGEIMIAKNSAEEELVY
ncbi:flagellar motor switch protein FliG [Methylobacterium aquaticum]|jgi:flagellar motor switch protein FliG|uniref:Flagellar motor switch protein FliG n=1 Tax=Methylobacterium aquaticum TaxID=270351 RepID=A0A0J6SEU6_9HYPH|nr:flagellar motor switch protein FliG [Methylobacterium aquaticum]KMO31898.1 flagellar motor switch protein FliG [Methylobacterium aquaticum]